MSGTRQACTARICRLSRALTIQAPVGEVRQHRVGRLGADDAVSSSRLARRTPATLPNAVSSALRRRGPIPAIVVELGAQVAIVAGRAVEGHGKPVRLVANALQQPQRRAVLAERDRRRRGRG